MVIKPEIYLINFILISNSIYSLLFCTTLGQPVSGNVQSGCSTSQ